MTLAAAFRESVSDPMETLIKRLEWHPEATLRPDMASTGAMLKRSPTRKNWGGLYSPTLEDLEANDWIIIR